jgi:hypothetical protein
MSALDLPVSLHSSKATQHYEFNTVMCMSKFNSRKAFSRLIITIAVAWLHSHFTVQRGGYIILSPCLF